jgi:hypothetical protein
MVRDLALDMNISRASQLQYTIPNGGLARKFRECGYEAPISASRMVPFGSRAPPARADSG